MSAYQPVNCEFHDVIEACATLHKVIDNVVKQPDASRRTIHSSIADVFACDGVEYLKTQRGEMIRLDHLFAVDGHDIGYFVRGAQCNLSISE